MAAIEVSSDGSARRPGPFCSCLASPERARREREHVDDWQASAEVRSGKAAFEDFDFEKPRTDLLASDADPPPHHSHRQR